MLGVQRGVWPLQHHSVPCVPKQHCPHGYGPCSDRLQRRPWPTSASSVCSTAADVMDAPRSAAPWPARQAGPAASADLPQHVPDMQLEGNTGSAGLGAEPDVAAGQQLAAGEDSQQLAATLLRLSASCTEQHATTPSRQHLQHAPRQAPSWNTGSTVQPASCSSLHHGSSSSGLAASISAPSAVTTSSSRLSAIRGAGLLPAPAMPQGRQQPPPSPPAPVASTAWPGAAQAPPATPPAADALEAASIPQLLELLAARPAQQQAQGRQEAGPLHDAWGMKLRYPRPASDSGYAWVAYPQLLKAQWRLESPGYDPHNPRHVLGVLSLLMAHTRSAVCLADLVEVGERFPEYLTLPLVSNAMGTINRLYPNGVKRALSQPPPGSISSSTFSSSRGEEARRLTALLRQLLTAACQQVAAGIQPAGLTPAARWHLGRNGRLPGAGMTLPPLDAAGATPRLLAQLAHQLGELGLVRQNRSNLAALGSRLAGLCLVAAWQRLGDFGARELAGLLSGLLRCGMMLPESVTGLPEDQQPSPGLDGDDSSSSSNSAGRGGASSRAGSPAPAGLASPRWQVGSPEPSSHDRWRGLLPGTPQAISSTLHQSLLRVVAGAPPGDLVLLLHALSCHGLPPPATTWEAALQRLAPALSQPALPSSQRLQAAQQLVQQLRRVVERRYRLTARLAELELLCQPGPTSWQELPATMVDMGGGDTVAAATLRRARQRLRRAERAVGDLEQQLTGSLESCLAPFGGWRVVAGHTADSTQQPQLSSHAPDGQPEQQQQQAPEPMQQQQQQSGIHSGTVQLSLDDLDELQSAVSPSGLRPRHLALLLLALGKARHAPGNSDVQAALFSSTMAAAVSGGYHLPELVAALRGAARWAAADPPPGWVAAHVAAAVGLLPAASLPTCAILAHSLASLVPAGHLDAVPPQLVLSWCCAIAQAAARQLPAHAAAVAAYPPHRSRSQYILVLFSMGRLLSWLPKETAAAGREVLGPAVCSMAGFSVRLLPWASACDLVQLLEALVRLGLRPPPSLEAAFSEVLDKRLDDLSRASLLVVQQLYRAVGWRPSAKLARQLLLRG